jgi:signal transduction histidine kinase
VFQLFHSATVRLTLYYLCIIMLLSGAFSVALFRVSTNEFNRIQRQQEKYLQAPIFQKPYDSSVLQPDSIAESVARIRDNLLLFNLGILIIGGGLSYALARQTLQPIEDAVAAQDRFTADASHEFRTPLTAMKTEIEVMLREKKATAPELRATLQSNLEEIEKLEMLSSGLLTLAHHDQKEEVIFTQIALHEVAREAVARVMTLAKQKNITIEIKATKETIAADQWGLTELLTILLENAVKYSENDKKIWLTAAIENRQAIIRIKDEGIGIKASDLPYIFNRFYRADLSRSSENVAGYGLGLSIAEKIVELHQGKIKAESTPGKGTVFTIILPVKPRQHLAWWQS